MTDSDNWKSTLSFKTYAETSGLLEPESHHTEQKTKHIIISRKKALPNNTAQGEFTNKIVLQEESFHWNLNFAISLMANLINLNSIYYYIFGNLSDDSFYY